jgi:hypothetical protein
MSLKNMVSNLLPSLSEKIQNWDGKNIQTVLIFGSFANGKANINSDLDLLLILKEFKYKNRQELWEDWHRMIESSWESWFSNTDWEPPPLSPVIRLKDSVSQGSPLFWDMIEYKIILWDTDNFFQNYLEDLRIQMTEQGTRKRTFGGLPGWELKPNHKKGESIQI